MWLLLALAGVSIGLAYAFLSSDNSEVIQASIGITDQLTYRVISNGEI